MKINKDTSVEDIYFGCNFHHKKDLILVIAQTLGWFHSREWLCRQDEPEETIKGLIEECWKEIKKKQYANCSTGGLRVELWMEENELFGEILIEI